MEKLSKLENIWCTLCWMTTRNFWKHTIYDEYIKYPLQKLRRGYSDPEWYSFEYSHSEYCIPRLKHLRKVMNSWPGGFYEEIQTPEDWGKILDEMIEGFEANLKLDNCEYETTEEATKLRDKLDRGMTLFGKYYWHLWD